jgi:RES domain
MAGADSATSLELASVPLSRIQWTRACRLIPSRFPTAGLFDRVASPADLEAVFELEGWTNDRISLELGSVSMIPRDEWVTGAMASVVMAAFCHPRTGGARFSGSGRGAWYAAKILDTAIAEAAHRRFQELLDVGSLDARLQMRLYVADIRATFHDVRSRREAFAPFSDPDSYAASQDFGRRLLQAGSNGVVYRSVRHHGGECLAAFRPRLIRNVRIGGHYEFHWSGSQTPQVRKLD